MGQEWFTNLKKVKKNIVFNDVFLTTFLVSCADSSQLVTSNANSTKKSKEKEQSHVHKNVPRNKLNDYKYFINKNIWTKYDSKKDNAYILSSINSKALYFYDHVKIRHIYIHFLEEDFLPSLYDFNNIIVDIKYKTLKDNQL